MHYRRHNRRSSAVGAVAVIAVGVMLLLNQNGILRFSDIWRLWPMIFVLAGATRVTQGGANARAVGSLMIGVGVVLELAEFRLIPFDVWQLWPVGIIAIGLLLLWKAIRPHDDEDEAGVPVQATNTSGPIPDSFAIFGGGEKRVTAPDFARAEILAIFGGYKLDLRKAELKNGHAVIDATAVFGGVEIVVPEHWNVIVRGVGIFGGYVDETHHPSPGDDPPKLVVKGVALFGGVGVKN